MAQRTIYECDRCHTEFLDTDKSNQFPSNWSWSDCQSVRRFILCELCTAALGRFLNLGPAAWPTPVGQQFEAETPKDDNGPPTR